MSKRGGFPGMAYPFPKEPKNSSPFSCHVEGRMVVPRNGWIWRNESKSINERSKENAIRC